MLYRHYGTLRIKTFYKKQAEVAISARKYNSAFTQLKAIPKSHPIRILVLEGGGTLGLITAKILNFIEQQTNNHICQLFDVISGTSIGALSAITLTIPNGRSCSKYSAQNLVDMIGNVVPLVLKTKLPRKILTGYGLLFPLIDTRNYIALLKHYFKNVQLSELSNNLFLPAYDAKLRRVIFFSNKKLKNNSQNYLVYQLASGMTAIPGMMPPQLVHSISSKESHLLLDPGIILNNPVLAALLYADMKYPHHKKIIVFIGTGHPRGKRKTTIISNYMLGIIGEIPIYANMIWHSNDELLHVYMKELSETNSLGLSGRTSFFINDIWNYTAPKALSGSKRNLELIKKIGDEMIKKNTYDLIRIANTLKGSDSK